MADGDLPGHAGQGPLLRVRDVTVRFGGVAALSAVSLDLERGEICGLIGPNGAGKTTLFDVIAGLRAPTAGQIVYEGTDITRRSSTWRSRRGIRRTFQRQQTFGWLSVEDNLMAAMEWRGGGGGLLADLAGVSAIRPSERARRRRAEAVLEVCGLTHLRHRVAGTLPIGGARLVELGRAIVDHPSVLLLDEPTSGLEEAEAARYGDTVERMRAEEHCGVLVVEHDMHFVMTRCDRVVVLDLGTVVAEGTPADIAVDPVVASAYLG